MAITVNIRYTGENGNARKFAEEMTKTGIVEMIRAEQGNLRYEYYISMEEPDTVLLIDSWTTPMMKSITELREKYDLHMAVERYVSDETDASGDDRFIRK